MRTDTNVHAAWGGVDHCSCQHLGPVDLTVSQLRIAAHLEEDQDIPVAARRDRRARAPDPIEALQAGVGSGCVKPGRPGCLVIEARVVELRVLEPVEEAPLHDDRGDLA